VAAAGAALLVALLAPQSGAQDAAPADGVCAGCHEDLARGFAATIHGRVRDFELHGAEGGCVACHGDGAAHAESGDASLIKGLGDMTQPEDVAEVCTACHRSASLHDWPGSTHEMNGVGCGDCHNPHIPAQLATADPDPCYRCHTEVQAQFEYPSHHPVREGHMVCASCHTPHGGSIGLVKNEERVAELCFDCHTYLQGPFVFEHEPVMEGCDVCHNPHGAVANNLLVTNEPFLCLQCHEMHFHAGLEGNNESETYIPRFDPANNPDDGITYPDGLVPNPFQESGYKRAFTTKCTQCHTQVHGSDLPSQTVPGQGNGLMR
jgi:DmsE family decaheme c-type cytochrome